MNEVTLKDLETIKVMKAYGCKVEIGSYTDSRTLYLKFETPEKIGGTHNITDSINQAVIDYLEGNTPEEGTPNSEMADEEKGLVQLLFEIEKATGEAS